MVLPRILSSCPPAFPSKTIVSILLFREGLVLESKKSERRSSLLDFTEYLNPKTTLAVNLAWSRPNGYLSDPYKQIGITETLYPGDPVNEREVFYLYPENRPDKRNTYVLYTQGVRYFETTNSSAEISYRYFADDAGLSGHTYELSWLKRIGEKVVLQPIGRLYLQDAADYYFTTLDGTSLIPSVQPDGSGPFLLSRLQAFRAQNLLVWHQIDLLP